MWTRTFSKVYQGVTKQEIWKAWTDVSQWTKWQGDIESCTLEGSFVEGNHFLMKIRDMKNPVKAILTEVVDGKIFTDCTSFLGAKMYDIHEIEETSDGVRLVSKIVVKGPLRWLWVKLVANNVVDSLPGQMDALVAYVRSIRG